MIITGETLCKCGLKRGKHMSGPLNCPDQVIGGFHEKIFFRVADRPPELTTNPVNPEHYRTGDIECIDAMRACTTPQGFSDHCRLTALKYIWRMNTKGLPTENAKKAIWYLRMAIGDDPREDRE